MKHLSLLLIISLSLLTSTAFTAEIPTLDDNQEVTVEATAAPIEPAVEPLTDTPAENTSPNLIHVTEIVIATAIIHREPVEPGTLFSTNYQRLYCHSRIASLGPATITHIWYRNGEPVAEIPLEIGAASSWRTWSSKTIFPATPASWRVEIVTEDGILLGQTDFTVE